MAATIAWPGQLVPAKVLVSRYRQQLKDTTVRTQMDTGPDKVRRRSTAAVVACELEVLLTGSQVERLFSFYRTDTASGSLPFAWIDHRTGGDADYRFTAPPSVSPRGPRRDGTEWWSATFSLELLPGSFFELAAPPLPEQLGEAQRSDIDSIESPALVRDVAGTDPAEPLCVQCSDIDHDPPSEDVPDTSYQPEDLTLVPGPGYGERAIPSGYEVSLTA